METDEIVYKLKKMNIPFDEQKILVDVKNYYSAEFYSFIEDSPENPWGYIAWGDMYLFYEKESYHITKELYKKAELIAKDDIELVNERLGMIE